MKKIYASQVQVGMQLPCDVFNEKGVLLWVAGSTVKSDQQVAKLAKDGFRSDLQEWIPPNVGQKINEERPEKSIKIKKTYIYNTVLEAFLEIQLPLIYIFDVFKSDSFFKEKHDLTHQIKSVVDVVLDVCEKHPEETIATIHMFQQAKHTMLSATYNCALTALICQTLKLSEDQTRNFASAALTANGSIVKLQDALLNQKTSLTAAQKEQTINHPYESLILLTRAGVREDEWLDAVFMHHEYMDGSGFPRGLKNDDINLGARVLCVADTYLKLVMPKKSIDPPTALKTLYKRYTKKLDKNIVLAVVKLFGVVPPGTVVDLKEGGVGIVIKTTDDKNKPEITKVGEKITNFYSEFNLTRKFGIASIIRTPDNLPKKLFKLWSIYESERKAATTSVASLEKSKSKKRG